MNRLIRNDPCWCGSGKKYKQCHLKQDRATRHRQRKGGNPADEIIIKTEEQIKGIRQSSRLTRDTLDMLTERIIAGVTADDINQWVHEYILDHDAIPAPLNYRGFPKSVCTTLNDGVCHGIPDGTVLQEGDILNVDVTTILNGYYGDSSRMFLIGQVSDQAHRLVEMARQCLDLGIEQVKPGCALGDIGHAIQQHAEGHGYSVVRDYIGHGTGIRFHEPPQVRHFGKPGTGIRLSPNMIFTIEPMINVGGHQVRVLQDNWTVITADGSLSAQWEHTVRVTQDGVEILTA